MGLDKFYLDESNFEYFDMDVECFFLYMYENLVFFFFFNVVKWNR